MKYGQSLRFKGGECLVAQVRVVLESKGELSVPEIVAGDGRVVEPLEEVAEGEETLVEGNHHLRIRSARARLYIGRTIQIRELIDLSVIRNSGEFPYTTLISDASRSVPSSSPR